MINPCITKGSNTIDDKFVNHRSHQCNWKHIFKNTFKNVTKLSLGIISDISGKKIYVVYIVRVIFN